MGYLSSQTRQLTSEAWKGVFCLLRKSFLSFLLAGTIASMGLMTTNAYAAEIGDPILSVGSTGPLVRELQQQLKDLGYFPASEDTTEYFGPITEQAVIKFKQDHNLSGGAKVGKTTEAVILNELAKQKSSDALASTREKVVEIAKKLNGSPYAWGGSSPSGFDCSGFTKYVFDQVGVSLPRTSEDQFGVGQAVSKSSLKPGDLVFFSTYGSGATHVGIYLGDGQFIHAASSQVQIDRVDDPYYWSSRYVGAKSVLDSK
jgi:cell wall-associated NlpC family hydrolase